MRNATTPFTVIVVCFLYKSSRQRTLIICSSNSSMSPIAIDLPDYSSTTTGKSAAIRKPRVYSLEPLHSRALSLAREKFELVLPSESGFEAWRTQAEGLLARNAEVTASDTRELKKNNLRYIAKQGVGVDNFDLEELQRCEIPLMNTPGVNVNIPT